MASDERVWTEAEVSDSKKQEGGTMMEWLHWWILRMAPLLALACLEADSFAFGVHPLTASISHLFLLSFYFYL